MKTLVIGYGNDSRRDDGVGHFVIRQLAAAGLPDEVTLEMAHQLEVELAETLSGYDLAIFVDAAVPASPAPILRANVTPAFQSHAVAHYLTPPDVLSLCQTLYGRQPQALLFSIRGEDFNFGMELSPAVAAAGRQVVEEIVTMLTAPLPQSQAESDEPSLRDAARCTPAANPLSCAAIANRNSRILLANA